MSRKPKPPPRLTPAQYRAKLVERVADGRATACKIMDLAKMQAEQAPATYSLGTAASQARLAADFLREAEFAQQQIKLFDSIDWPILGSKP